MMLVCIAVHMCLICGNTNIILMLVQVAMVNMTNSLNVMECICCFVILR